MNAHIIPTIIANAFALPAYASAHQDAIAAHMLRRERADGHRPALPPSAMGGDRDQAKARVMGVLQEHGAQTIAQIADHLTGDDPQVIRRCLAFWRKRDRVRNVGFVLAGTKNRAKIWEAAR